MLKKSVAACNSIIRNNLHKHFPLCDVKRKEILINVRRITDNASSPLGQASPVLSNYTSGECELILNKVNTLNLEDLLCYDITKARANKLLGWRKRNGQLRSVEDILMIEGFGVKLVEKFYGSLVKPPSKVDDAMNKPSPARSVSFLTPNLNAEERQKIHSSVAVRVGVSSVTWSRLETLKSENNLVSLYALTHWQHHEITDRKLHLIDLIQRCKYIDHLIPEADCYIFENPQMAQINANPGSVQQQNINIQKAQLTAIIGFALSVREKQLKAFMSDSGDVGLDDGSADTKRNGNKTPNPSNVFYLRRFLASRLFNNLVGNERVSSEEIIKNLMRTHYNDQDEISSLYGNESEARSEHDSSISCRGHVQFPNDLRYMFSKAERFHREFLGQSLLLNLAFVRLVLQQDPYSLSLVSRKVMKSKENDVMD